MDNQLQSTHYDRECAWCDKPNELVGYNDAQLVFDFYYLVTDKLKSHGMCGYCTEQIKNENSN